MRVRGEQGQGKKASGGDPMRLRNGVPVLPRRPDAGRITLEIVNGLRDDEEFLDPITGRRISLSETKVRQASGTAGRE